MELKKAIKILSLHNEWRRGADTKLEDPFIIGKSIDVVLEAAIKYVKLIEKDGKEEDSKEG